MYSVIRQDLEPFSVLSDVWIGRQSLSGHYAHTHLASPIHILAYAEIKTINLEKMHSKEEEKKHPMTVPTDQMKI